jgi:hypothetical protein
MGIRDGFGETGAFDERALLHQTIHGHPIVGGFLARVPSSLKKKYAEMPVVRSLLAMSDGHSGVDAADAALGRDTRADALRQAGVRFIVLDRRRTSEALRTFVAEMPLTLLARDEERDLLALY